VNEQMTIHRPEFYTHRGQAIHASGKRCEGYRVISRHNYPIEVIRDRLGREARVLAPGFKQSGAGRPLKG